MFMPITLDLTCIDNAFQERPENKEAYLSAHELLVACDDKINTHKARKVNDALFRVIIPNFLVACMMVFCIASYYYYYKVDFIFVSMCICALFKHRIRGIELDEHETAVRRGLSLKCHILMEALSKKITPNFAEKIKQKLSLL